MLGITGISPIPTPRLSGLFSEFLEVVAEICWHGSGERDGPAVGRVFEAQTLRVKGLAGEAEGMSGLAFARAVASIADE